MLGFRDRLVILMYHRVLAQPDIYHTGDVDAAAFDWQMAILQRYFNVLPLTEAAERLRTRSLPPRAVAITFDDGYADNVEIALPILQRHKLHATFFIATGYLNGGRMWNDTIIEAIARAPQAHLDLTHLGLGTYFLPEDGARVRVIRELLGRLKYLEPQERLRISQAIADTAGQKLPHDLMMTTAQLRTLSAAGMGIGAHTISHPILSRVSDDESRREIDGSIKELRELLGQEIRTFAYPNGRPGTDYARRDVEIVSSTGIRVAVSTAWGYANSDTDSHQLARIAPWDATPVRFALRIFRSYFGSPPIVV